MIAYKTTGDASQVAHKIVTHIETKHVKPSSQERLHLCIPT
uniref:Uncharacterized protein n=1 Tax=Rhizophora mucronata TaxID=61149 RepID=A0A2P2NIW3_RHIMU